MKIRIHRGTHQIGGIAAEISTDKTRIIIDMGDELSLDPDFKSAPLDIPGVTDNNGSCDAVLFTHYHGDHIGQMERIREDIPMYSGALAKDIMLLSAKHNKNTSDELICRMNSIQTFEPGIAFMVGDIQITPFSVDHSACDSYMFLIEADGKKLLYTGDFRTHGFRGKAVPKIMDKLVRKVDALVIEGTTLSRSDTEPMTEHDLQQKVKKYIDSYKYVFVLCASTNLERICALSKAVPTGKYFLCDSYQYQLLESVEKHWGKYSEFYQNIKKTIYSEKILDRFIDRGFVMAVRDNNRFREIIQKFDPKQSIILYSMWDGYRTKPDSTIPSFLELAGKWEPLHTSGHASHSDLQMVIEKTAPEKIIPIHTDDPDMLKNLCPDKNIVILNDNDEEII
ncbi:MAG: MBL fold metallo-hydrolase [Ruminococcus sp.]|nr:MBL fold metallo-hydrolase [Ruminococcus sp.]